MKTKNDLSSSGLSSYRPRRDRGARRLLPAAMISLVAIGLLLIPVEALSGQPGDNAQQTLAQIAPARMTSPSPKTKSIRVLLVSKPHGAEIFQGTERRRVGRTTLEISVPKSDRPLVFVALFADGAEVTETIIPNGKPPTVVFVKPASKTDTSTPTASADVPTSAVGQKPLTKRSRKKANVRKRRPRRAAKVKRRNRRPKRRPTRKKRNKQSREGTIDPFQ